MADESFSEIQRAHLRSAILKLKQYPIGTIEVKLYVHEAEALFQEFCRLANFATLLGEPSPAEMAGIDEHGHVIKSHNEGN